jgi:hypothetical protein
MPHTTLTIGPDGPAIDVTVGVGPTIWQGLAGQGNPPPPPLTLRSLIDTGSDLTAIHPKILQQFGGSPVSSARIRRPGQVGYRIAPLFEIRLSIGGLIPGASWIPMRVAGVAPSTPTVLALIGRDVLEHCTLF